MGALALPVPRVGGNPSCPGQGCQQAGDVTPRGRGQDLSWFNASPQNPSSTKGVILAGLTCLKYYLSIERHMRVTSRQSFPLVLRKRRGRAPENDGIFSLTLNGLKAVDVQTTSARSQSPLLTTPFRFSNVALEIIQVKEKNLTFDRKFKTSSLSCQLKLEWAGEERWCHVVQAALSTSGEREGSKHGCSVAVWLKMKY